jgi:2-oxoglutarate dehydrogenase E1 component
MNEIVIGMPHRGRLSILHHVSGKPFWKILREFTGKNIKNEFGKYGESGDVKYHMW